MPRPDTGSRVPEHREIVPAGARRRRQPNGAGSANGRPVRPRSWYVGVLPVLCRESSGPLTLLAVMARDGYWLTANIWMKTAGPVTVSDGGMMPVYRVALMWRIRCSSGNAKVDVRHALRSFAGQSYRPTRDLAPDVYCLDAWRGCQGLQRLDEEPGS